MESLLQVRDLEVSFGTATVVQGLSFTLEVGKTLAIVGESGSGKSVSCLSMLGLIRAGLKGSVKLSGAGELIGMPESGLRKIRGRRIAMIFQEPMTSLNPVQTCGTQVCEAIRIHRKISRKQMREEVLALFKAVELPDPVRVFRAFPHELSGGQKQRVMIAMAISCNPDILIADEPTTALDVTVQRSILDLLKRLQRERNMSMIFITHDLGVVKEIADEVLVMRAGRIEEQGCLEDVMHSPRAAYTRGLLACRPPLDRRPMRLPTVKDVLKGCTDFPEFITERPLVQGGETILKASGLRVIYRQRGTGFFGAHREVEVLKGVNFEIRKGEIVGLVGESGCGKSTLGRAVLRLQPIHAGEIYFRGMPLHGMRGAKLRKMRRHFQLIFQDPFASLNPRMSVGEAIAEPMWVHGIHPGIKACREAAKEWLEMVGIPATHYDRLPHQFSGGQRQRIGIARALGLNPDLLVCDESVSALDVSVQAQILNLLLSLRDKLGISMLFISHDLSVVKYISDRLMVMHEGQIVEEGNPDQLYSAPAHAYTRKLISGLLV